MTAVPADAALFCPRCQFRWYFVNISEGGVTSKCGGCEWTFTLGTPTINTPAVPASTVTAANASGSIVAVTITGGTLTQVKVNAVQVGTTAGTYLVPVGGTISITYTVAPAWAWALPVTSGAMAVGAVSLPVASGGTNAVAGQLLLGDAGTGSEVFLVGSGSTGTSIVISPSAKAHGGGISFGNVVLTPANLTAQRVPAAPGYGF